MFQQQYTINRAVLIPHSSLLHKKVISGEMEVQGMTVSFYHLTHVTEFPQTIFSLSQQQGIHLA